MGNKHGKFEYSNGVEDKKPLLASPDEEGDTSFEELDTPRKASKIKSMKKEGLFPYFRALSQKKYRKLSAFSDEDDVAFESLKILQKTSKNNVLGFLKPSDQEESQSLLEKSDDEDDNAFDNWEASQNFQEENFPTPDRKASKQSFRLSIRSGFSYIENGQEFSGKNFFNMAVPINLISKNKKLPYILHISKFGNPWKKLEDLTIVRGMGDKDESKMVCYKRDDEWNVWYLTTTFPADENDLNQIVKNPELWAIISHSKRGDEINAYQLLSESVPRSFRLNQRLERTYQAVFHVTTFNIHLEKYLELMRVQGQKTSYGTEYYDFYTYPTYRVDKFIDRDNSDPIGEFFFKFH